MTTYETPIVAGVFKDEIEARKAVDMLRNAQFERDQLGVAMRNGGSTTESLSNDFMNLGVPRDRANFYEHEFEAGKIVVSVRPDGREEEAKTILHSNGAYDYDVITPDAQAVSEAQSAEQPELEAQTAQEQPAQEKQAQSSEHDPVQEPVEHNPYDSHVQFNENEHATEDADTNPHDQSQVVDAQPDTNTSQETMHDPENA